MPISSMTSHGRAAEAEVPAPLATLLTWPLTGRPAQSPLRHIAAAGAIAEAISHLPLLMQSLSEAPYIGVGFLLLSVAGFLLAQLLIVRDTLAVWLSTVAVSLLASVGYVLSQTTGLPQLHDYIGQWAYPLGIVSLVGEGTMLITGLLYLTQSRGARRED